jgi:hypothetical protein
VTRAHWALASLLALFGAACQCVTFPPETSFRCDNGSCPEGFVCSVDGYCDSLEFDGGSGGGSGGGAGGGNGGGAGGGNVVLAPCAQAWCWEHPRPWGEVELRSVFTTSANNAWLVGDNAAIFHWNGSKWAQVTADTREDLNDVWVSPDGQVWAVGKAGGALRLESGRFVDRSPPGVSSQLWALTGTSGTDFWAAGENGTILHHQNGLWNEPPSSPGGAIYRDLSVADPTRLLVGGSALQHLAGANFVQAPSPLVSIGGVWVNPGGEAWLGGTAGALYKSSGDLPDAGAGWTQVAGSSTQDITSLWGLSSGEIYYGSGEGVFALSGGFNGGISAQRGITGVHATDPSNVWAVAVTGQVVRRTLPAQPLNDIRQQLGVTSVDLNAVSLVADGTAFAVGNNHVAMRRNSAGQWGTIPVEGAQSGSELFDVWSDGLEHAVIVGEGNVRLATFDAASGTFKRPVGFTPSQDLNAAWGSGSELFAAGDVGLVVHFDGAAWSVLPAPGSEDLEGIWGLAPNNLWVVGDGHVIYRWDGAAWTQEHTGGSGSGLTGISGAGANDVYAVGTNGTVLKRALTGAWTAESADSSGNFEAVALADGLVMAVTVDGHAVKRDLAGSWARVGTAISDALALKGVSGANGKGFLAVGDKATVIRWTP